MTTETRISKAKTLLLLDFPWFGALSMRLKTAPDNSIDTFNVDGITMRYNTTFADTLTDAELQAVIAHEVMHCALLHIFRRNGRDPQMWNEAADYAINLELTKAGLKLPKGCLLDTQYTGMSAETIYAKLKRENKRGTQPQQPTGNFSDAPTDGQSNEQGQNQGQGQGQGQDGKEQGQGQGQGNSITESDWTIAAEQAARVAKKAGKLSGELERAIQNSRESITDWKAELREFIEAIAPSDYSWSNPNRRFVHTGLYLPGTVKEGFGKLAIAIDTSGSINQPVLDAFASELRSICSELHPESVTVLYCDAAIKGEETFTDGDEIAMHPKGGGGTSFAPVFEALAQWEELPKCLLYFTDMENSSSEQLTEPEFPTLWITGLDTTRAEPFGRMIKIPDLI